jgi:hypothetical protein
LSAATSAVPVTICPIPFQRGHLRRLAEPAIDREIDAARIGDEQPS